MEKNGNFDPNNLLKHVCSVEYFKENFSLRLSTRFEQKLAENREKIMIMYKKNFSPSLKKNYFSCAPQKYFSSYL